MPEGYPDDATAEALLQQYAPLVDSLSEQTKESSAGQIRAAAAMESSANLAQAGSSAVTFSQATAGVTQALSLVEQEIGTIHGLPWTFTGENQMETAAQNMQAALSQWSGLKKHMPMVAASVERLDRLTKHVVNQADEQTVSEMSKKLVEVLNDIQPKATGLAQAGTTFRDGVQAAYQSGANANQVAQTAINQEKQQIDMHIKDLQSRINSLNSAGSVILGILTFGGTIIHQIIEIRKKQSELGAEEYQLMVNQQGYQAVLAGFYNVNTAVSVLLDVLQTLDNALQQLSNQLNDVIQQSSQNPAVALTLLKVFAEDVAAAANQAKTIGG